MDCYNDHRDIKKVLDVPRLLKTRGHQKKLVFRLEVLFTLERKRLMA